MASARSAGSGQRRHQGGRLSLKLIVRHHPADQTGSPGFLCAQPDRPWSTRSRATFFADLASEKVAMSPPSSAGETETAPGIWGWRGRSMKRGSDTSDTHHSPGRARRGRGLPGSGLGPWTEEATVYPGSGNNQTLRRGHKRAPAPQHDV